MLVAGFDDGYAYMLMRTVYGFDNDTENQRERKKTANMLTD